MKKIWQSSSNSSSDKQTTGLSFRNSYFEAGDLGFFDSGEIRIYLYYLPDFYYFFWCLWVVSD